MDALPPLRDVIKRHGLSARKSLGQNFLLDLNLTGKIARSAGDLSDKNAIEIGPGPGGLTRALLAEGAKTVTAVEKDERCLDALAEISEHSENRLKVIQADALETNLTEITPPPRIIVANLPYNIATPLLIGWLKQVGEFESMTLMFQKEVADRIVAHPRSKAYGRLSILTQWLCDVKKCFDIPPSAFTPPPKIVSTVVHFKPRQLDKTAPDFKSVEKLTEAAFGQRRKMLRKSLSSLHPDIETVLEEIGLKPTMRAEEVSVEQFIELARRLEN